MTITSNRGQTPLIRLNKTLVAVVCVFLCTVQLGYSYGLWGRVQAHLFSFNTETSDLSPVELEWIRLHTVGGKPPTNTLREEVAKGVLPYNNADLINYVRQKLLVFPDRSPVLPVKTNPPKDYSELGEDKIVDHLLNHRTYGFFIEVGKYDGGTFSNTLFLEKERNWTGLLVEADPNVFQRMKGGQRQAYLSNACLSTTQYAISANFTSSDALDENKTTDYTNGVAGTATIQCIPFMSYLLALKIGYIDYLSLAVNGTEIEVLKQIDFNRYQFDILSIEYAMYGYPGNASAVRLNEIRKNVLSNKLYYEVTTIGQKDVIFMRNATVLSLKPILPK